MLQAIIDGQTDPARLASYVTRRVKATRAELLEALGGHISAHHRFMLKLHLGHIDALDKAVADLEKEVGLGLAPFRQAAQLLSTMPVLSDVSAWAAVKVKGGWLQAQFHRLRARRGAMKAIMGVAASMLAATWHVLRNHTEWHDRGASHFDRADAATRLIRRLQQIGYALQVTPA